MNKIRKTSSEQEREREREDRNLRATDISLPMTIDDIANTDIKRRHRYTRSGR